MSTKFQLFCLGALLLLCGFMAFVFFRPAFAAKNSVPQTPCPAGSYNINTAQDPVCKLEPTGCPYGDSIPMEMCDKFESPESQNVEVPNESFQGK